MINQFSFPTARMRVKMKNIIEVMKEIKPNNKGISPFIEYRTQTVWSRANTFETFVDKANQATRDEYQFVPLKKFLSVMFNGTNREDRVKKLINRYILFLGLKILRPQNLILFVRI